MIFLFFLRVVVFNFHLSWDCRAWEIGYVAHQQQYEWPIWYRWTSTTSNGVLSHPVGHVHVATKCRHRTNTLCRVDRWQTKRDFHTRYQQCEADWVSTSVDSNDWSIDRYLIDLRDIGPSRRLHLNDKTEGVRCIDHRRTDLTIRS